MNTNSDHTNSDSDHTASDPIVGLHGARTAPISRADEFGAWLKRTATTFWAPAPAGADQTVRRIHLSRQIVVGLGALATLLQMIIWLIIAIVTVRLDSPWWLWSAVATGIAAATLTGAEHLHRLNSPTAARRN